MTAASRARFAEVVRTEPVDLGLASLLVGVEVDPALDVDLPLAMLDALAASARPLVPPHGGPAAAAEGLRVALGVRGGFGGSAQDYADVRSSLLHEVVVRARGLPLLLTVVWTEVAARLDVPAFALALPGHVVAGIGDPDDEHVHVDPFAGGRLLEREDLETLVRSATGRSLSADDLRPAPPDLLLLRLLTNVRGQSAHATRLLEGAATRLWATELSLLLPRHPLGLRRERGELLVRLGRHLEGAAVLEDYASLVEPADEQEAELVRREAAAARARLN